MLILFKSLKFFPALIALSGTALGAEGASDVLNSLWTAETNFAQMATQKGTRHAFLANLADDAIVFDPGPVNGKRLWLKRKSSEGKLTWQPIYADVSRAGDLGYTTGPWEFKKNASDPKPAAYGQFLSVWKRQLDGTWKVVLDGGIETPEPTNKPFPTSTPIGKNSAATKIDLKFAKIALADAERELNKESEKDARAALISAASDSIRIFRPQKFPVIGKEAIEWIANFKQGKTVTKPFGGSMSQSGDLAYSYGEYTNEQGAQIEHGSYVRIWKREPQANWKLVVESHLGQPEEKPKTRS